MKTFSQAGSLTLGGNVSVAVGPVGRNAEAAGAASLRSVAGIFSYSKTEGLFAGVSLEGSIVVERKDANTKLYGRPSSALPAQARPLLSILNSRAFSGMSSGMMDDRMHNGIPVYNDREDPVVWANNTGCYEKPSHPQDVFQLNQPTELISGGHFLSRKLYAWYSYARSSEVC